MRLRTAPGLPLEGGFSYACRRRGRPRIHKGKKGPEMIVYRKSERETATGAFVEELMLMAEAVRSARTHELATELLIEFGRFEYGVGGSLFPAEDGGEEIPAPRTRGR